MLVLCPECGLQVSDKALSCPHCGFPFKEIKSKRKKGSSRMRLPNGFGQISEIKGQNLRKPFRAMVTVGFDETGHAISRILKPEGYFATYNDAYMALLEYHKDPRAFGDRTTFKEVYERWIKDQDDKDINRFRFGFNHLQSLWNKPVQDIGLKDVKEALSSCSDLATSSMTHVRNLLNHVLDYCVERELISQNVAKNYVDKAKKTPQKHHQPFTKKEMDDLWGLEGKNIYADMMLVGCYMGWRPSEMLAIRAEDISDNCIKGGMKTDYGRNRIVPIHSKISAIIERYTKPNTKLFNLSYQQYLDGLRTVMPNHSPHDCRVTFISMLKNAGVNEYIIKRLAGHSIKDLTESVYTHWDTDIIRAEVEKI